MCSTCNEKCVGFHIFHNDNVAHLYKVFNTYNNMDCKITSSSMPGMIELHLIPREERDDRL